MYRSVLKNHVFQPPAPCGGAQISKQRFFLGI